MKKLTQKQAIFYQLYKNWQSGTHAYIPVFEFMGEVHCTELDIWGFVSHECSPRTSELNQANPDLLEYIERKARAGGTYRCWRIKPEISKDALLDPAIIKIHTVIKRAIENAKPIEYCDHRIPKGALCTQCKHPIPAGELPVSYVH